MLDACLIQDTAMKDILRDFMPLNALICCLTKTKMNAREHFLTDQKIAPLKP